MTIWEIPRNDLAAARAYYEAQGRKLSQDEYGVLWSSQDDPAEFERLSKDWSVDERPSPNFLDEVLA